MPADAHAGREGSPQLWVGAVRGARLAASLQSSDSFRGQQGSAAAAVGVSRAMSGCQERNTAQRGGVREGPLEVMHLPRPPGRRRSRPRSPGVHVNSAGTQLPSSLALSQSPRGQFEGALETGRFGSLEGSTGGVGPSPSCTMDVLCDLG